MNIYMNGVPKNSWVKNRFFFYLFKRQNKKLGKIGTPFSDTPMFDA